jgi:hypothetical protein
MGTACSTQWWNQKFAVHFMPKSRKCDTTPKAKVIVWLGAGQNRMRYYEMKSSVLKLGPQEGSCVGGSEQSRSTKCCELLHEVSNN